MSYSKKSAVLLLLIIVLGAALRVHDLAEENFWTDEMVTINHLREDNYRGLMKSVQEKELTPPGYFIFLKWWSGLFGISEFSLRLPSVIFDVLSIILIYFIGKELFSPRAAVLSQQAVVLSHRTDTLPHRAAVLSSLILATSMLPVVYAQEARPFALVGCLALLSTLFLLNFCKKTTAINFFSYALVTGATFYFSYMALFLIAGQLVLAALYCKDKIIFKDVMAAAMVSLLLMAPGIRMLIQQTMLRQPALQASFAIRGIPPILAQLGIGLYLLPLSLILMAIGILLLAIYKLKWLVDGKYLHHGLLAILILFMIGHLFFLEVTARSFSLIRHSFLVMPFFYLAVVKALSRIKLKQIAALYLIALFVFNGFTLYFYFSSTTKAPWEKAINYLEDNSDPGALILFDRSDSNLELFNYYKQREFRILRLTWKEKGKLQQISEQELFEKLREEQQFWLISSRSIAQQHYFDLLTEKYRLLSSRNYTELKVYRFGR